jgi:anti-sigma B factor antagonist
VPEGDFADGRESRRSESLGVEVRADREAVIPVDGELDVSDTQWFTAFVSEALENDQACLAIDAGRLTYLDSSGLGSLLLARAAAIQAGVAFYVSEASPMLRHLAERTGLRRLLLDNRQPAPAPGREGVQQGRRGTDPLEPNRDVAKLSTGTRATPRSVDRRAMTPLLSGRWTG